MSENTLDVAATEPVASQPVAPQTTASEAPGSTPATVDATASEPDDKGEKPQQSRSESRRQAATRRETRDLARQVGYLQAQLDARQTVGADGQPTGPAKSPQQIAHEARDTEAARTVVERLEDAGEDIEGFDKVMATITGKGFPINVVMRDYLGDSDKPAQMAQWLAENPKEAQRISLLSDAVAVRALERAESKLSAKPAPKTTQAPPPVPTVGGRSTATFDPDKASMEDYAAHWQQRQAKR